MYRRNVNETTVMDADFAGIAVTCYRIATECGLNVIIKITFISVRLCVALPYVLFEK